MRTGEIDPKLSIAFEDMHDRVEKADAVGQQFVVVVCVSALRRGNYIRISRTAFYVYIVILKAKTAKW